MRLRDSIPFRHHGLNLGRCAYFIALSVCQRCIRVGFAVLNSVLRRRIFDVVRDRAEFEVIWIHTLTVVAGVHDQHPRRNWSVVDFVRVSMGSVFVTWCSVEKAVPIGRKIRGPFPASSFDDFVFDAERFVWA